MPAPHHGGMHFSHRFLPTARAALLALACTLSHGGEWSCASFHGNPPTTAMRHASTGKTIAPFAPMFNPERFTDTAKVDKWFRRNCKDVASRECTAAEKADMLAWLLQFHPKDKP